MGEIEATVYI